MYLKKLYDNELNGTKAYLQDIQRLEDEVLKDGGDTCPLSGMVEYKNGSPLLRIKSTKHPMKKSMMDDIHNVDAATKNKF